ncbi:YibE/F family protein [Aminipila butyrica]|uniref:YibE/F family protein n=1 Tax=Aminipila butyrica TaxID=433296 RepID=A0A858BX59_9FIRM|nr:YibE/F family protein [Aminipila butyrica]QIB70533.1 YibE/F family protein [Aminipila butyrica]
MQTKNNMANTLVQRVRAIKIQDIILFLIIMIVLILGVITVFHNYNWYDTTIVKIEKVQNLPVNQFNGDNTKEKHYIQKINGIIMNGKHQGQEIRLKNQYASSNVLSEEYSPGNEVFIKLHQGNQEELSGLILGLKRDKYMSVVLAFFIFLLVMVTRKKAFFSLLSLVANIAVLLIALDFNYKGYNILRISILLVMFFTFASLLFISGFKKKTLAAILSTLLSLGITISLYLIFVKLTGGVDYTYMEYIAGQNYQSELFMSQILLGGLGAIMDVAITEASAMNELLTINENIALKELIQSGREVGFDIMGTMINIMLFTYVCSIIPIIVLKLKNGIKLSTIIRLQIPMELYGFIIGSIGVLLAIPISVFISIAIFKRRRKLA